MNTAYDFDEQEKFDAFKRWWSRYGMRVGIGVAVVALAWGGWGSWQAYQLHINRQAMSYFEILQETARVNGTDAVARIKAAANTLRENYSHTGYAARGALIAARALQARQDSQGAREQLEWLAKQPNHVALQPVAKLRLAGLLLDQKEYALAQAQLQHPPPAFAALFNDRRGDILVAQGKRQAAREAWQSAIEGLYATNALASVVRLKRDALGSAEDASDTEDAKVFKDAKNPKDSEDAKGFKDAKNSKDTKSFNPPQKS